MDLFEDSTNLQAAISKAIQESKALLCFVTDDNEESTEWEGIFTDPATSDSIRASSVALKLTAGSEQANYLNAVCPIRNAPAIIIIFQGQVVGDYQANEASFEDLRRAIIERFGTFKPGVTTQVTDERPRLPGYLELPVSEGRMRLPNNAYDSLRKITQQYLDSGVSGKALLRIQLNLLKFTSLPEITASIEAIEEDTTNDMPILTEEATARLLNMPAAAIKNPGSSSQIPSSSTTRPSTLNGGTSNTAQSSTIRHSTVETRSTDQTTHDTAAQRAEYVATHKASEAERARIKAQIEADKKARREADRKAKEEAEVVRRRTELQELRKANSTTANPKASDIRIQVRTFDGGTIRSSFANDQTISKHVRPWIDEQLKQKGIADQPYNLKLLLTPMPNRSIETAEEDLALSDVDDVRGSATLIMVPVRTFVEGYASTGSGVVGSAAGAVGNVLTTGFGLVNAAAGTISWGLSRLMGASTEEANEVSSRPEPTPKPSTSTRDIRNMRVRTLADQRRDEEDETKRRGTNLYNGMGLNVEPRKDDNDAGK